MQYPRFHEAAHAIACQRGIKDTSRQGRYHNSRFKAIAEEVGLDVSRDPEWGWSVTALSRPVKRLPTATRSQSSHARCAQPASRAALGSTRSGRRPHMCWSAV